VNDRPRLVAVFGASTAPHDEADYTAGVECGRLLVEAGYGVITGGYGGIMEAVSRGAAGAGGRVIGATAPQVFANRSGANRYVGEERPAESLTERLDTLIGGSIASIVLSGSIGTLAELTVSWYVAKTLLQHGGGDRPVVAVGPRWRKVIGYLEGAVGSAAVTCVDDVGSAVAEVKRRCPSPGKPATPRPGPDS
jgi:uncharacterized protein (TIGR00725 family)